MATFDLFSKRQKRLRGEIPDVYKYDEIPSPLRAQIIHIWYDALGNPNEYAESTSEFHHSREVYENYSFIVKVLCREYGLFKLFDSDRYQDRHFLEELANYFLNERDPERILDVIELSFKTITNKIRNGSEHIYVRGQQPSVVADRAINELNTRFQENGIGYEFCEQEIIRIDSKLVHKEAVIPALKLLNTEGYEGAEEEFRKAFEHYRHGRMKESLVESLKSIESLLKAICKRRKWKYSDRATCSDLLKLCFEGGLIPDFWQNHFNALRTTLESGVPTGRNKLGGHGQGEEIIDVPPYIAAYVLHLTASAIVFLAEADKTATP